jgi:hypothetical protein
VVQRSDHGFVRENTLPPELAVLFRQGAAGNRHAYRLFLQATARYLRKRLNETSDAKAEATLCDILTSLHDKRHTGLMKIGFEPWFHAIVDYKLSRCWQNFRKDQ